MLRILVPAALVAIGVPLAAAAFKEGPYPNVAGGFGEQSCHLCHLDNPINDREGEVTLTGVPPTSPCSTVHLPRVPHTSSPCFPSDDR